MGVGLVMIMTVIMIVIMVVMGVRMSGAVMMQDAFHMMMMAALRQSDFRLEAQDLSAVFAQAAVHGGVAGKDLANALNEGVDHQRMVI